MIVFFTIIFFLIVFNSIFYKPLKEIVRIEVGENIPEVKQFLSDKSKNADFVTNVNAIDTNTIGEHTVEIKVGFFNKKTQLKVVDSIAPKGQGVKHEIWYDETLEINEFVRNIEDQTDVILEYKKSPDYTSIGKQIVSVILIDEGNNQTTVESELMIKSDKEAPIINGVKDQLVFIDEPISYRRGVTVTDNKDDYLDFEVDNSNVDLTKTGRYEVIYKCEDKAGNLSMEKAFITLKEKPKFLLSREELKTQGDKILKRITNDRMSDLQILNAIFWYTRWNIKYTGQSDKTSWEIGASKALEDMEGDCFNYYSLAHLLLERAGFDYLPVKRIEGSKSRHYWLLVKYDDLWYHFDPTWSPMGYEFDGFMISEEEATAFTKLVSPVRENYYVYDESLYEDIKIAQEPLVK